MKKWTTKEIEILKNNYAALSHQELMILFSNRTRKAIQVKAFKLKLTWPTVEERFWKYVDKKEINECWNWIGYRDHNGYGRIKINRVNVLTHRFSWVLHNGTIPMETPCVCHHCDNPKCVNPEHLFLGTHEDNIKDRDNKNRQARRERQGHSKLTSDQVKQIRDLKGKLKQREIAEMFNVCATTISNIHKNKIWIGI